MLIDRTPLLRDIVAAVLKAAGVVVVLAILYPLVVTTIARSLNIGPIAQ
jgi:hypothetical protein